MKKFSIAVILGFSLCVYAEGDTVTVTINNLVTLDHVVLAWQLDSTSVFGSGHPRSNNYQDLTGGVPLAPGSHFYSVNFTNYFSLPTLDYSVLADYGGDTGATLAFSDTSAPGYLGQPWPLLNPQEDHFISSFAINNADQWDLAMESMYNLGALPAIGATSTLVNFSNGTLGGTAQANVTPAPEPSSWLALGGGAVLLFKRRRR